MSGNLPSHYINLYGMWLNVVAGMEQLLDHPVTGLTPYSLRYTFCTDLQRAGVPINVAKELMGHSDIKVTANIYTHREQAKCQD